MSMTDQEIKEQEEFKEATMAYSAFLKATKRSFILAIGPNVKEGPFAFLMSGDVEQLTFLTVETLVRIQTAMVDKEAGNA